MCGIAGFIHREECSDLCQKISKGTQALQACRGPDNQSETTYKTDTWIAHFYHQHLRISDLNPLANQPMKSKFNKSLSLILNGEIYNHSELKSKLKSSPITHSDTEVLVELLAHVGTSETLKLIRGMFAWATIDVENSRIELVRDRFGEKPLHIVKRKDSFFFSSQYDAAVSFQKYYEPLAIDISALNSYMSLGFVPYRQSLIAGIEKITPGGKFTLNLRGLDWAEQSQSRWISPLQMNNTREITPEEVEAALRAAVKEQLQADVPVGLFLSGGVDSSLISVLAQQEHTQDMKSFSVGFENSEFDESNFASKVSKSLGTQHFANIMTGSDALAILDKVNKAFVEPLGDPSVFPTTFVSEIAKKHVSVCLTGDGADELFFGYGRYSRFQFLEKELNSDSNLKLRLGKLLAQILEDKNLFGTRGARLNAAMKSNTALELYLPLIGFLHSSKNLGGFRFGFDKSFDKRFLEDGHAIKSFNWLREFDMDAYLTDDILVKVDRAAMASSLETRAPFLDPRVVDIARMSTEVGLVVPSQKSILKKLNNKLMPGIDFDRKKQGFGAPLGDWFRNSLKDWSTAVIEETDWSSLGFIESEINKMWLNLMSSNRSDGTFEWLVLSLGNSIENAKKL
jgi:asparagine synthase (glutamine-hydrolysing)